MSAMGQQLLLDGRNYTVIGVAPAGFQYPDKTEVWLPPLRLAPELNETVDVTQRRGMGYLSAVARLKPEASLRQAQAEMETITARLRQQYPETNNNRFNRVVPLQTYLVGDTSRMLWLLFGAVGCVLLIACANVANLLLARAATRRREMAVRAALGATRGRVLRQLMTESLLLALTGGLAGLLLAWWGADALTRLLPTDFPRRGEIALDLPTPGFALLASLVTALIFGLAPAWQSARVELQEALKDSARGNAGARSHRLRGALVMAEVALSLVLLVGAGLLLRGFLRLQAVAAGFDAGGVLTLRLSPSGANFRQDPQYIAYYQKVNEKLAALPGVEAVGAINTLPLSKGPTLAFRVEGQPERPVDQWPGANPVGRRINFGNRYPQGQPVWFEGVGVVGDVRSLELKDKAEPEIYLCAWQDAFAGMSFVLRTSVEPSGLAAAVREAVREVDAAQPVTDVRTMQSIVGAAVTQPRFNLTLLGVFGALALLLSAAGIYGVTAYTVAQRTQEIGIRRALGAQNGDVLRLALRQSMGAALLGIAVGLAIALAATQLLQSLLFEVSVTDPLTFGVVSVLLVAVALMACWIPARRATQVYPLVALRED